MSKHLSIEWISVADRLARIGPGHFRSRCDAIAMALADTYRQGYGDSRKEEVEEEDYAAIILRTLVSEAQRTGSWTVPIDLQERIAAWLKWRDIGGKR